MKACTTTHPGALPQANGASTAARLRPILGCRPWLSAIVLGLVASHAANAAITIRNCTVTKPPNMVFVTNLLGNMTSATSFSVSCSTTGSGTGAAFTVALSQGAGTVAQRRQANGVRYITYNLYQDAGYSNVWGTSSADRYSQTITGPLTNQQITIYGKIDSSAANLADQPGVYSDPNITLTLRW